MADIKTVDETHKILTIKSAARLELLITFKEQLLEVKTAYRFAVKLVAMRRPNRP